MKNVPIKDRLGAVVAEAVVDDEDLQMVSRFSWYLCSKGYAAHSITRPRHSILYMHRLVNDTPDNMITDHINGNKLDNRRCNLRSVTDRQNCLNRHRSRSDSELPVGVWKVGSRYRSRIKIGNTRKDLGTFDNMEEALEAYRKARREILEQPLPGAQEAA